MRYKVTLLVVFSLAAGFIFASDFDSVSPFVENAGQVDNSILFYSQNSWGNVVIQKEAIVFEVKNGENRFKNLYLKFKNSEKIEIVGENPTNTYFNFIKGLNPEKWVTDVKVYESLMVKRGSENEVFLISSSQSGKPFLSIEGNLTNYFYLDADIPAQFDDGHLTVQLENGTFELNLTQKIQDFYDKDFYDKSTESQSIVFSTYLGGSSSDHAFDLALDQSGNVVVSGNTYSTDIPVPNGYDTTKGTTYDMYIAKLSSDGQNLLWGTYIGGTYEEAAFSVKVNSLNEIVFGGRANADTPAPNGNQSSENFQIYIGKLSSDGRNLLFGTKLGGGQLSRLVLDSSDNIYFVAHTSKSNLACVNGYDCSFNGGPSDLYIGKLNSSGVLLGSTYLGGSDSDANEYQYSFSSFDYAIGSPIALDFDGNIIVSTKTESSNLPIAGGYQQSYKGDVDLYIAKLSNDCSTLLASTYLGGSLSELIGGVTVDGQNNIIVAGNSRSTDLPVLNAYQSTNKSDSGKFDGYIAKFNSSLSQLIFGTYLGGKSEDLIRSISVDGGGNVLVTGVTYSSDFPLANPLQGGLSSSSSNDNFISLLGKTGSTLLESTYFGGNYAESPYSIIFSPFDNALICGRTSSRNFPTANAYRNTLAGERDIFVSKLSMSSLASCKITCSANVPYRAKPNENVSFTSTISVDPEGCSSYSVLWDFGDGSTSTEANPTHKYTQEGSYTWKLKVSGSNAPNCEKTGGIVITNSLCEIECSANVPPWAMLNSPVNFASSATSSQCSDPINYLWDFGDGSTSTEQNAIHTYTQKGTYTWKLTVSSGIVKCEKSDTIYIDTERPCLQVGNIKFCADYIVNDGSKYTLNLDVSANDTLFFTNQIEVNLLSQTTASIYSLGDLYVKNVDGADETLIKGPVTLFVDGFDKSFTETSGPALYNLNLLNLPLEINGSEIIIEDDGVLVTPFLNIGVEPLILARVQMSLLLVPNDSKHILSVEVINGSLTPSISVASFSLVYNPQENSITGSASIGLPFLDIASIDASVEFKPGCLDGFSITIGLPQGIPLGTSGLEIDEFILEVDSLCEPAHFYIFIGGSLAIEGVPSEIIALEHLGLGYQVPYTLNIDGGTLTFLGYGLASMGGTIVVYPPSVSAYGNINIFQVYTARISLTLDIANLLISGNASGSLQIPDWDCCASCLICKATRAIVRKALGSLPYTFGSVDMGVSAGRMDSDSWGGYLRGKFSVGSNSFAAELKFENGEMHFLVGTNYDNLFQILLKEERALSPTGYEKSINLGEDKDRVIFSASGVSSLPEIYLVTPEGITLTKENYSSYQGASYYESDADKTSFFEITPASKGTWKFGMTNLNQGEGDLFALCSHQAPKITFESVSPSSKGYSINLKVEPKDEDTKVSLFYTNSPDFANGLSIEKSLTSTTGNYNVEWDTTNVPNGNYLIFAKADDGKNPEEVSYFQNQLSVNKNPINPPTNLSGARNGETATLSWTPSTSSNIAGYDILYTDEPEVYGYKYRSHSVFNNGGSVSGLELNKIYRFAVIAYDTNGNYSLESNSITLANTPPPVITSMTKLSSPFRINVLGSNLQQGIKVYINGTQWNTVTWKSTSNIKIKGGSSLKALVPKGVDTTFKFVNPDGGETSVIFRY